MGVEQLVDEAGGFQLAELAHALAEALAGQVIDLVLVEAVFVHEFEDQVALLVGALPGRAVLPVGHVGDVVGCGMGGIGKHRGVSGRRRVHAVIGGRHESGVEDLPVHVGLEELVETLGLRGDVVGSAQLGFHRDGELVR